MTYQTQFRVWLTLEKIFGVDIYKFRYKFVTGRLWNDKYIVLDVFKTNMQEVCESLSDYINDRSFYLNASIDELQNKRYITSYTKKIAKRIYEYWQKEN